MAPKSSTTNEPIRVLFIASEADPLVKVGGLGDVAGSLPPALRQLELERPIDVRLVIPFHSSIRQKISDPKPVASFSIHHASGPIPGQAMEIDVNGQPIYLISGPPIPFEAPVYNPDASVDGIKYTFFTLAALQMARTMNWQPDIIHANDWHTAISPAALARRRTEDPFWSKTHSLLTIHNLPFMGAGSEEAIESFGFPPSQDERLPIWARQFPLPLGLLHADHIVAVSPTYSREILTPEFGCGLESFLLTRTKSISGILNGLDTELWNPATDPDLVNNYSLESVSDRKANKIALLNETGLTQDMDAPLLIMIGRMDQQKGVDLAIDALKQIRDLRWQAIILGTGDRMLQESALRLAAEMPGRVKTITRFDIALSHRMYSAADIILMPSRYEPCGLAQMIAMRYGCVPLVRATGGLRDTVRDAKDLDRGTGFLFDNPTGSDFVAVLHRALTLYPAQSAWQSLQKNGMKQDFSWKKSALSYVKIYNSLMEKSS